MLWIIVVYKITTTPENMEDLYNTEQRLESVLRKIKNSEMSKSNKAKLLEYLGTGVAVFIGIMILYGIFV